MQGLKLPTALFKCNLKINFLLQEALIQSSEVFYTGTGFYNGTLSWTDALAVGRDANCSLRRNIPACPKTGCILRFKYIFKCT